MLKRLIKIASLAVAAVFTLFGLYFMYVAYTQDSDSVLGLRGFVMAIGLLVTALIALKAGEVLSA